MAEEIPTIQILEKANYFAQTLLPLPTALPYPPLPPSTIRLRTSVLSLTINNFTYAALGTLLKWWDVHPLPPSTPAPYNDSSKYGRISAWGYAEVIASTVSWIPQGAQVWGYVPLGTLAQDLEVARAHADLNDQFIVTSPHRANIMPIYNRYFINASPRRAAEKTPEAALDAVLRVMHPTAFLLSHFVFAGDAHRVVAPGPGTPDDDLAAWTSADADLRGATVLVFAPGSKVAATFAALLGARDAANRPYKIVGASSDVSRAFVLGTGLYDAVVSTAADEAAGALREAGHEGGQGRRLVVFDFGGRAGVASRWATALAATNPDLLFVGVGSGIMDPAEAPALLAAAAKGGAPPYKAVRVNADDMRRRAMKRVGEVEYWAEEARSLEEFRKVGIKGLDVTWGEGMRDVIRGWDRLAKGEVLPSEGLVYKL